MSLSFQFFFFQGIENLGIQLAAHAAIHNDLGAGDILAQVSAQEEGRVGKLKDVLAQVTY